MAEPTRTRPSGSSAPIGLVIVALLAVAAAMTVANVVRLAAYARRDEIEIMQLVGAPFAFIRGPFVAEGILQGGAGALVAIVLSVGHLPGGKGLVRAARRSKVSAWPRLHFCHLACC